MVCTALRIEGQRGIALLGAMVLVLILTLLGTTLLNLAIQDRISAGAGKAAAVTQQLTDAAGELVLMMFHSPDPGSSTVASVLEKRNRNATGSLSFFDPSGRSQFVGSASNPDLLLDARNAADDHLLNDPQGGLFRALSHMGTIQEVKVYAPSRPGLLCTVEATVAARANPSFKQSVTMQLSALEVPPIRAAVQAGQSLGALHLGHESAIGVHWGDLKVDGDLVVRREVELPVLSALASVSGHGYDDMTQREDRWNETWIGGTVHVTQAPSAPPPTRAPSFGFNVHLHQNPVPGVRPDKWDYDQLKTIARQYGSYYAIDRDGLLYPQGNVELGRGVSPDTVFHSDTVGDQLGLIFIDTLDQTAPRADNLGTVIIRNGYLEGVVVVQGHVILSPGGPGQSLLVMSPPSEGSDGTPSRTPVRLSQIHVNGMVHAAGNISVTGKARVFGAVIAGGTIVSGYSGDSLEVWYNYEFAQGLYRGLPVVYPARGTWMAKY